MFVSSPKQIAEHQMQQFTEDIAALYQGDMKNLCTSHVK